MTSRALRIALAALACTAAFPALPALAQDRMAPLASIQVPEQNAALKYWEAFAYIRPKAADAIMDVDWSTIGTETDPAKLPAGFREALAEGAVQDLGVLRYASNLKKCDFEIRYDEGFMALVPHVTKMRLAVRLLVVQERDQLHKGNSAEAVDHLGIMLRMASHLRSDRTLLSSLVGTAIATTAVKEVDTLIASGALTSASRDEMIKHLRAVDTADPFNIRGSLELEFTMPRNWIARHYGGPGQTRELVKFLAADGSIKPDNAHLKAIDTASPAELTKDLERYEGLGRQVLAAFDKGADLTPLSNSASAGDHGHWAALFAPSLQKPVDSVKKFRSELKAAIDKLVAYKPSK